MEKKIKFISQISAIFQRMRFFAWFAYPLIVVGAVGFVGKEVVQRHNDSGGAENRRGSSENFIQPNEENARAEFIRRLTEFSGSFYDREQKSKPTDYFISGWIMQNDDYRAFEAVNSKGTVALKFLSTMKDYRGEFKEGAIVPAEGYAHPGEDPMAHAMTALLDVFGDPHFGASLKKAINEAQLESVFWQGRDCIALSFRCGLDKRDVTVHFEQPEMKMYGRVDEYDNGLKIRYMFDDFKPLGESLIPRAFAVHVGNDGFFRVKFSSMTTPVSVSQN